MRASPARRTRAEDGRVRHRPDDPRDAGNRDSGAAFDRRRRRPGLRLFLVEWGYYVLFESLWSGTPGKRALGIRVIREGGSKPAKQAPHSPGVSVSEQGEHRRDVPATEAAARAGLDQFLR